MKISALLAAAEVSGDLTTSEAAQVSAHLAKPTDENATPWYLHLLVAVGAWVFAGFFLEFLFVGSGPKGVMHIFIGLLLVGLALAGRHFCHSPFLHQICLALSITGCTLALNGMKELGTPYGGVVLAAVGITAVLYSLYPDSLHRFLTSGSTLVMSDAWIQEKVVRSHYSGAGINDIHPTQLPHDLNLAFHCVLIGGLFLCPSLSRAFRPVAYAAVASLFVAIVSPAIQIFIHFKMNGIPAQVIFTLSLLGLLAWAFGFRRSQGFYVLLGVTMVLGAVANPGTLVALCFLVLGFGLQDRLLLVLGGTALPIFLCLFYYDLQLTLAHKSLLLLASGAILLVLRVLIHRLPAPDAT